VAHERERWIDAQQLAGLRLGRHIFVAFSVLALAIFVYTNSLVQRQKTQTVALSRSIAGLCASATYAAKENEQLRAVFGEFIEAITFPIIITDVRGVPITWKGLPFDADPNEVTHETYMNADPQDPPETPFGDVIRFRRELDKQHAPIPMTQIGDDTVQGYIHYGDPSMTREMRFVPVLELIVFATLITLGYVGFRNAKIAELRSIWAGLAKETAHQLGTPISSLLGWVELTRECARDQCEPDEVVRMADEMQRDLERLEKISLRFSHIGSAPKTERQDIVVVLREAVDYLERRVPALRSGVAIEERYSDVPLVDINRELMEWVVENLVKNSIEAVPSKGGRIEIRTEHSPRDGHVRILFTDNGRGLSASERRRIFMPGYSTKRKGWGLGLALARRIVEEYHKGKLSIASSEVGVGTTFVVSLPAT